MKIVTIIGARPQFIKAAVLSRSIALREDIAEVVIHTGQHYDKNMSDIFFKELNIPKPDYNLEIGSFSHGKQTGQMIDKIEEVLMKELPDWVVIYGDTNSTIAGALAATKLNIKVAHVEAGLRSFNRKMPEEINRIATDHISDCLFAPTINAMDLLEKEGLENSSYFVGDIMYDSVLFYMKKIRINPGKYRINNLPEKYYLATLHRPQNTDNIKRMKSIFSAFSKLDFKVVLPLHPRTKKVVENYNLTIPGNVKVIEPVGYLEMLMLLDSCEKVLTDSGGLQKEAFFLKKQCVTLRDETEWIETLSDNWNFVVGGNESKILKAVFAPLLNDEQGSFFGNGNAAELILGKL